jgi:hypothetical protein
MNPGPGPGSPILVSAFRSALLQQRLIVARVITRTALSVSVQLGSSG